MYHELEIHLVLRIGLNSVQGFKETEWETKKGKLHTFGKLFTYENSEVALGEPQIESECMDHLVVGVDATVDMFCSIIGYLSRPEYVCLQRKSPRGIQVH